MNNHNVELTVTIPIAYKDDYIVVVNKPTGWLVHRSWLDTKENKILMLQLRNQIGQHVFPIHRLDKPTSGLLIMGLNPDVANHLSKQFENQEIEKTYHAIIRGFIHDSGTIDYPLKVIKDKIADKFSDSEKDPQIAITHYKPLHRYEVPIPNAKYDTTRYSLIELSPKTGRKHQLRRHLRHLRHPIIGDTAHGDLKQNRAFSEYFKLKRLMLHASSMSFIHPITHEKISVEAEYKIEADWQAVMNKLQNYKMDL
ncbi:tRNA pseudouridine(65) synthase TruC [Thorsellia anophelis]|uniref:tRNA pseudouridine synthase C n=1 Tax=Thorsellia anophelis DSM 18579 TaxID=1123402 RepID=A0A1I0BZ97_9GAMM|nr:tRNA pseudouridine(65) synthase TruC [Thorsellia anophelis]SET11877.1 tRNA pseudouridine65 synthase [Thorsellia anophelis DSM 18579]